MTINIDAKYQVMAFGDSLTWGAIPGSGGRHEYHHRWTSVLQALVPEIRIVAEGLGGRTTSFDDYASVSDRNGAKTLPMLLGSHYPLDLVMILLGTNDLKPHICGHINGSAAGIQRLVEIVRTFPYGYRAAVPQILIMSPPHFCNTLGGGPNGGRAISESEKFKDAYQAIAIKEGCGFFDCATVARASEADGVHLDIVNTQSIGQGLAPVVSKLLGLESVQREPQRLL